MVMVIVAWSLTICHWVGFLIILFRETMQPPEGVRGNEVLVVWRDNILGHCFWYRTDEDEVYGCVNKRKIFFPADGNSRCVSLVKKHMEDITLVQEALTIALTNDLGCLQVKSKKFKEFRMPRLLYYLCEIQVELDDGTQ